jgi:hypothetical protein
MPRYKCPKNPKHKIFHAKVVEHHDWKVDENGNFVEDLGSTDSGRPEVECCAVCSAPAVREAD